MGENTLGLKTEIMLYRITFFIMLLVITAGVIGSDLDNSLEKTFGQELERISKSLDHRSGIYFVQILDGYFPVLERFIVSSKLRHDGARVLVSYKRERFDNIRPQKDRMFFSRGFIYYGETSKCDECQEFFGTINKRFIGKVVDKNIDDITVRYIYLKGDSDPSVSIVFNEFEFLLMQDQNIDLFEFSFEIFLRTRNRKN